MQSNGSVSYPAILIRDIHLTSPDYVVYDVWLFVELLVVYFMFVETGNNSLEQTAALLDGEDAKDRLVETVAKNTTEVEHVSTLPDKA